MKKNKRKSAQRAEAQPGRAPTPAQIARSLGWLIALVVLLSLLLAIRLVLPSLGAKAKHPGDGKNPDTYGFDLSNIDAARGSVVAGGLPKDGIRALVEPENVHGAEVEAINEQQRRREHSKFLVPSDRVIGVEIGGEARAYPLRVMAWHEAANDTLGGLPVLITYSPLCDSVAVFDRRVGGETLEFGVSGLLCNSNQLLFDRREKPEDESLWSQLGARAIAGPAAGTKLETLPCAVVLWRDWIAAHPETTVVTGDRNVKGKYESSPYASYFLKGEPRFPVVPEPPGGGVPAFERVIAVRTRDSSAVFFFGDIAANAGEGGVFETKVGETPLSLRYTPETETYEPPTVEAVAEKPGAITSVTYSFWFAWYAFWAAGK
ncbi:MAG: DUF3179 domain-containing protein [bacterium]|jgi:hypothetical protein